MRRTIAGIALLAGVWSAPAWAGLEPSPADKLKAGSAAISQTTSLFYNAQVVRESTASNDGPTTASVEVMIKKAADEGGVGWKLYIGGDLTMGAKGEPVKLHIAFDGFAARSLRESEKSVYEKNAKNLEGLEPFLVTQGGRDALLWNLLTGSALGEGAQPADIRAEGVKEAGGERCDVVSVKAGETQTRYFLAISDHFPRRVESVAMAARPAEAAQDSLAAQKTKDRISTTLVLTNVKRNVPISESSFIIDVPDEFMVRAVKDAAPKADPASKPEAAKEPRQPTQTPGLLPPGSAAPDWSLKDGDGKAVSLASLRGKVVVLDFWGTWCPPCRAALPSLEKIHQKYKSKGVVVLGMNFEQDPAADPKKYMADNSITYGLILHGETVADKYKVPGFPTFYVINPIGEIVWGSVGFDRSTAEEHEADMSKAIEQALKEGL